MPVPVVHIGYHKTATSWLQQGFLPRLGERVAILGLDRLWDELIAPHPFEFDAARCRRHVAALLVAHAGRVPVFSAERLCGNPHSGGYDAAEIANRLRAALDEARILIVVREQVAMLVSNYKQYVRMGGVCGFEEYLFPPRDGRIPLFRLDHFRYDHLVEHYVRLFSERDVLVLPYELLRQDRAAFARRVLDHLGLDGVEPPDPESDARINVSLTDVQTRLRRWVNLLGVGDSLYPVRPRAPWLSAALFRLVDRLGDTRVGRRPSGRFRERAATAAGDRYAASNRRLQRYVPYDLAAFGYRLPGSSPVTH